MTGVRTAFGWLLLALLPAASPAQTVSSDLSEAFDFEREERYEEAAERYRQALESEPTNILALLGLERVLDASGGLESIAPQIAAALASSPNNPFVRALEVRIWATLDQPDSSEAAARRWMAVAPASPEPYREWAFGLAQRGSFSEARGVLLEGGRRVGGAALAQDVAELSGLSGEFVQAARQWHVAVAANDALADGASTSLARTPERERKNVLNQLQRSIGDATAKRMAADLMLAWGRPGEAWALLDASLPEDRGSAISVLQRFAEQAGLARSPESSRSRGYALERIAGLARGVAAERARIDAARAFADAGERQAAQRMLERVAADSIASPNSASDAMAALIGVLAEEGRVEEAAGQYRQWAGRMSGEEAQALRIKIAWAWLIQGDGLSAKTIVADDSAIGVLALRGWMSLFIGDLRTATKDFRAAGPHAGTLEEATERTEVAALIQQIEPDSVPDLGRAFYTLARGDTNAALREFATAGDSLPAEGGRADVLTYTARIALTLDLHDFAQPLLLAALQAEPNGPAAPPAEFALAESYHATGQTDESIQHLEHLILTYPSSAMVPHARRRLDQVRGNIPRL